MTLSADLQTILNHSKQIEDFIKDIPKHHSSISITPTFIGFFCGTTLGTWAFGAPFFAVLAPLTLIGLPAVKLLTSYNNKNKYQKLFDKHAQLDHTSKTELLKQFKPRSFDKELFNFLTMNVEPYDQPKKVEIIKKASKILDNSPLNLLKDASTHSHSTDFWQYINFVLDKHIKDNRAQLQHKDEQCVIRRIESQLPDLECNNTPDHKTDETLIVHVEASHETDDNNILNDKTPETFNTTKKHSI